ncbi:RluA family pseudouridine synthase [Candidatus Pelagibacter sp.]|nr:RluA family pseudouridine synthase [Candidatus Pelagibacter sp.]|tara:strand:- start:6 stop:977 length:972 start_codon:yes stop_codon:yes gene_type:complete
MKKIINLLVGTQDDILRVDQFINKYEKDLSRSKIKNLILKKNLSINNKLNDDPSKKIKINDKISLIIPEPEEVNLKPFEYKIEIIYEDNDLLVLNKKADISMHPGAGNKDKTLVNALINYKKKLSNINGELRPGIVHRIDKHTSGLVVIAKNNFTHENLSNQFSEHSIERKYQTLVWGKLRPSNGRIETLITRSSKNRQLMSVSFSKGKNSITNYKTLEIFEKETVPTFSLIECKLETGRTHQIRVHMSYKGNNIVGDQKYKKKFKKIKNINKDLEKKIMNLDRQFLHAVSLGFTHPTKNKRMNFKSKLPNDLENILKSLRNA